jgi:hypothetical protein
VQRHDVPAGAGVHRPHLPDPGVSDGSTARGGDGEGGTCGAVPGTGAGADSGAGFAGSSWATAAIGQDARTSVATMRRRGACNRLGRLCGASIRPFVSSFIGLFRGGCRKGIGEVVHCRSTEGRCPLFLGDANTRVNDGKGSTNGLDA